LKKYYLADLGWRRDILGVSTERFVWPVHFFVMVLMLVGAYPLGAQQSPELEQSLRALHQGNYQRAALLAGKYIKTHPRASPGRIILAQTHIAQGQYLSAYQELREALHEDPKNIDILYYLGQLCNTLSQVEYQQLYALAPDSARVHQLQAELYRVQENIAKAEEEYQAALKIKPRSAEVLIALGDLARFDFRFDEALSYYSRALEIDPRNYDSAYGMGACYHFQQVPQKAMEYFRLALSIDPDSAAVRLAMGDTLLQANQPAEAVTELKAAVKLEPKMRQAYTLLGKAQQKLGQSREAEESFRKAQELIQSEMESREELLNSGDTNSISSSPSK
jgi:Tfp pilus assembly protein PilF